MIHQFYYTIKLYVYNILAVQKKNRYANKYHISGQYWYKTVFHGDDRMRLRIDRDTVERNVHDILLTSDNQDSDRDACRYSLKSYAKRVLKSFTFSIITFC